MTDPFDALGVAYEQGKHDCASTHAIRGLEDINRIAARGYDDGQRDALDAAVQRVEAIAEDHDSGVDWSWDYEADPTGATRNPRVWIREAVAAIKKGEQ